jgi:hypothetical protein
MIKLCGVIYDDINKLFLFFLMLGVGLIQNHYVTLTIKHADMKKNSEWRVHSGVM